MRSAVALAVLLSACGGARLGGPSHDAGDRERADVLAALAAPDAEILAARVVGRRVIAMVHRSGDASLPTAHDRVCEGPPPPLVERERTVPSDGCGAVVLVRVALEGTPRVEDELTLEEHACAPVLVCRFRTADLDGDGGAEVHFVYARESGHTTRVERVIDAATFAVELSDETGDMGVVAAVIRDWTFGADAEDGTYAHLAVTTVAIPPSEVPDPTLEPSSRETFELADNMTGETRFEHDGRSDCWRDETGTIRETEHEPEPMAPWGSRLRMYVPVTPCWCQATLPGCPP